MRRRRGGQTLADRSWSGIDGRKWLRGDRLHILREKAWGLWRGGSHGRKWRRMNGRGILKRLIDRYPPSSRWVLVDLRVGWDSHRIEMQLVKN